MNTLALGILYIHWLYGEGAREYARAWANFHWFLYHFFSVGILTATLFAPWRRLHEEKERGFDPGTFVERVIINTILRLVGFVMRVAVLAAALISHVLLFLFGAFLFVIFLVSPLFIPAAFLVGLLLFFS